MTIAAIVGAIAIIIIGAWAEWEALKRLFRGKR